MIDCEKGLKQLEKSRISKATKNIILIFFMVTRCCYRIDVYNPGKFSN